MRSNPETGEMEVFHSAALSDDLPEEDEVCLLTLRAPVFLCVYQPLLLANRHALRLHTRSLTYDGCLVIMRRTKNSSLRKWVSSWMTLARVAATTSERGASFLFGAHPVLLCGRVLAV